MQRTREQLLSVDIDLTKNLGGSTDFEFVVNGKTYIYSQGIIFTQQSHKGSGLVKFMELSVLQQPQRIVYVDDRGENVTALDHSLNEKYPQLEKILIRYSNLD